MSETTTKRHAVGRLLDRFVIWFWTVAWKRWLVDRKGNRMTVVKVKGWRTAIVDSKGGSRKTISPCFTVLGVHFY